MGLDTLELILEIEAAFGIRIADEDAQSIRTVGELYGYVLEQLPDGPGGCLSGAAFYRLRRGMCEALELPRGAVRPGTELEAALPRADRRRLWPRLSEALGLRLPNLTLPHWGVALLCFGPPLAVGLAALNLSLSRPGRLAEVWPQLVSWGACLAAVGFGWSRRFAVHFPTGVETAGELARALLSRNHAQFVADATRWHHRDVWDVLVGLVSQTLVVDPERVVPEADLIRDLDG